MRLLIVGTLKGQLTTATKIAMDNGATVTHAEDSELAMRVLRSGKGADLMMVDVAIDAGAKEYIPLPPDPELIAAVLAAVANDSRDLIYRDESMARVIKLAQQI